MLTRRTGCETARESLLVVHTQPPASCASIFAKGSKVRDRTVMLAEDKVSGEGLLSLSLQ